MCRKHCAPSLLPSLHHVLSHMPGCSPVLYQMSAHEVSAEDASLQSALELCDSLTCKLGKGDTASGTEGGAKLEEGLRLALCGLLVALLQAIPRAPPSAGDSRTVRKACCTFSMRPRLCCMPLATTQHSCNTICSIGCADHHSGCQHLDHALESLRSVCFRPGSVHSAMLDGLKHGADM